LIGSTKLSVTLSPPLDPKGASTMKISTVGIDLAKNVFQVHGIDEHGKAVLRKRLRRNQVAEFFVNLPPCLIGMETCGSAHHWARKLEGMAHTVRLMAPQHVKRYVKTNKNDAADAEAICEAVVRLRLPGEHGWRGTLVCDDFSGCKACFELGVTKAGCLAHARRKLHELWVNHGSPIGEQELKFFGELCAVEREVAELMPDERRRIRQEKSRKVADALQQWLAGQRQRVPEGSATARAIDYSLKRWQALTRYIDETGWRTRSSRSPSEDQTGCSQARYGQASALRSAAARMRPR
jgi:hypothetical protein